MGAPENTKVKWVIVNEGNKEKNCQHDAGYCCYAVKLDDGLVHEYFECVTCGKTVSLVHKDDPQEKMECTARKSMIRNMMQR